MHLRLLSDTIGGFVSTYVQIPGECGDNQPREDRDASTARILWAATCGDDRLFITNDMTLIVAKASFPPQLLIFEGAQAIAAKLHELGMQDARDEVRRALPIAILQAVIELEDPEQSEQMPLFRESEQLHFPFEEAA